MATFLQWISNSPFFSPGAKQRATTETTATTNFPSKVLLESFEKADPNVNLEAQKCTERKPLGMNRPFNANKKKIATSSKTTYIKREIKPVNRLVNRERMATKMKNEAGKQKVKVCLSLKFSDYYNIT